MAGTTGEILRKLPTPSIDFTTAFNETINGVGDVATQNTYRAQISNAAAIEANYVANANSAMLYTLPRQPSVRNQDPIIHGTLKKSDLTSLYTQYFVPENKPARRLYDKLKVTANGKCPLCGDIGHVRTLDHYLPKANFPLYSVVPANLVPCCRDCNSDKLNTFSQTLEGQTLHPYFDDDKYFSQKWVHARVIPGSPPVLEYYVSPPASWAQHEKSRVGAHLTEYGLAERFGIEAGADITETIETRRTTLRDLSAGEYSQYLQEKSNNIHLPINNWRRVMFDSLSNDQWFCGNRH